MYQLTEWIRNQQVKRQSAQNSNRWTRIVQKREGHNKLHSGIPSSPHVCEDFFCNDFLKFQFWKKLSGTSVFLRMCPVCEVGRFSSFQWNSLTKKDLEKSLKIFSSFICVSTTRLCWKTVEVADLKESPLRIGLQDSSELSLASVGLFWEEERGHSNPNLESTQARMKKKDWQDRGLEGEDSRNNLFSFLWISQSPDTGIYNFKPKLLFGSQDQKSGPQDKF